MTHRQLIDKMVNSDVVYVVDVNRIQIYPTKITKMQINEYEKCLWVEFMSREELFGTPFDDGDLVAVDLENHRLCLTYEKVNELVNELISQRDVETLMIKERVTRQLSDLGPS